MTFYDRKALKKSFLVSSTRRRRQKSLFRKLPLVEGNEKVFKVTFSDRKASKKTFSVPSYRRRDRKKLFWNRFQLDWRPENSEFVLTCDSEVRRRIEGTRSHGIQGTSHSDFGLASRLRENDQGSGSQTFYPERKVSADWNLKSQDHRADWEPPFRLVAGCAIISVGRPK